MGFKKSGGCVSKGWVVKGKSYWKGGSWEVIGLGLFFGKEFLVVLWKIGYVGID